MDNIPTVVEVPEVPEVQVPVVEEVIAGKDGDHGDGLQGFVIKGTSAYWGYLHKANSLHLTRNQQYTLLFRHLHSDGVAFKDIRNRLLNLAKDEGLYVKAKGPWCEDLSVPEFRPYDQLVKNSTAWAVALSNFTKWVGRNWESYTAKKVKAVNTVAKTSQTILVPQHDGTMKEVKIKITGLSDSDFDRWISSMSAPVDEDLSMTQMEAILGQNPEVLTTLYGNIAEEQEAVEEYNLFVEAIGQPDQILAVAPRHITPPIGEPSGQFIAN